MCFTIASDNLVKNLGSLAIYPDTLASLPTALPPTTSTPQRQPRTLACEIHPASHVPPMPQVHQKRTAMAAALEDPEGPPDLGDAMSTVSTAVTGLSAYTLRTHNPTASSASRGAASTVGGRGPAQQHKVPSPDERVVQDSRYQGHVPVYGAQGQRRWVWRRQLALQ